MGPVTRRTFLTATGALAAVAATGCGASAGREAARPKRGGTLRAARSQAIDGFTLDAQTANSTYLVSQAVLEPLLRFDSGGKDVRPGLAEGVEPGKGNRTFTLRLAEGASFSDGRAVTADDVAFSVALWKSGANYGSVYAPIERVRKLDDRTVRLELDAPNASLPGFLTWSIAGIVPDGFRGRSKSAFWRRPVGAGPFTVERWEAAGDIVLERNEHYHREGRPYVDQVVSSLTSDANQRTLQFRSEQVDVVEEILPVQASRYPADRRLEGELHFTDVLLFNTEEPPFDDVRVRRGVAAALDYEGIVDGLYKGFAEHPTGFLPPNVGLSAEPTVPYVRRDLDAAKRLLAEAGLGGEELELVFPSEGGGDLVAQVVQDSLTQAGLRVRLSAVETGTFLDRMYGGKFQLGMWGYNAISPDIADPVAFILATNYFFTGYPGKRLDAALQSYYASKNVRERRAAVRRMQDQGARDLPFIALDHYRITVAAQADVHGVEPSPWGSYYYDDVWMG